MLVYLLGSGIPTHDLILYLVDKTDIFRYEYRKF